MKAIIWKHIKESYMEMNYFAPSIPHWVLPSWWALPIKSFGAYIVKVMGCILLGLVEEVGCVFKGCLGGLTWGKPGLWVDWSAYQNTKICFQGQIVSTEWEKQSRYCLEICLCSAVVMKSWPVTWPVLAIPHHTGNKAWYFFFLRLCYYYQGMQKQT